MAAPTELVRGNAVMLILSCLAREPMHGYRIAREIERVSEGYFALGEGTPYSQLHQLEQDGWIEGYWRRSRAGASASSTALPTAAPPNWRAAAPSGTASRSN